ncbi:hypothetical protein [uncultured Limosilactobacillus sp.]|uniref:hypothetical protein n=1 Tax=uncultured Limosilactobacillus sp. TaxID=2837629 RepID=UPI00272D41E9|nr:hypothetical protein [uncultured Limosilactobacillus sp.]
MYQTKRFGLVASKQEYMMLCRADRHMKQKKRAKKKWDDKNKDKNRVYRYRSYARKFIRDLADEDDLKELEELIHKRVNE